MRKQIYDVVKNVVVKELFFAFKFCSEVHQFRKQVCTQGSQGKFMITSLHDAQLFSVEVRISPEAENPQTTGITLEF